MREWEGVEALRIIEEEGEGEDRSTKKTRARWWGKTGLLFIIGNGVDFLGFCVVW